MLLALQLYLFVGVAFALDAGVHVHREHGPASALADAVAFVAITLADRRVLDHDAQGYGRAKLSG